MDERAESVLLPIFGMWVPFHVGMIKNVSKSDEGDYVFLRLNFNTPTATVKTDDGSAVESQSTFIKALTFKSKYPSHVADLVKQITDLKKLAAKKEEERKDLADIVDQPSLLLIKGKRPVRLNDVYVRPIGGKKRRTGALEIHTNGLR